MDLLECNVPTNPGCVPVAFHFVDAASYFFDIYSNSGRIVANSFTRAMLMSLWIFSTSFEVRRPVYPRHSVLLLKSVANITKLEIRQLTYRHPTTLETVEILFSNLPDYVSRDSIRSKYRFLVSNRFFDDGRPIFHS